MRSPGVYVTSTSKNRAFNSGPVFSSGAAFCLKVSTGTEVISARVCTSRLVYYGGDSMFYLITLRLARFRLQGLRQPHKRERMLHYKGTVVHKKYIYIKCTPTEICLWIFITGTICLQTKLFKFCNCCLSHCSCALLCADQPTVMKCLDALRIQENK